MEESTSQMDALPEKLLKPYNPPEEEGRIYAAWEGSGFFNPDTMVKGGFTAPDAKPYTIMMPPPNVTGVLHMGHALMLTVEDILIRYKRMRGYRTLWLPGTDHAAIATQSKVEKEIQKQEGKSRHDLGREEMLKRIEQFAKESHDTIVSQVKVMGASCDWSREAFTLDAARTKAVQTVFKKMYDEGLIYRGHRIVNWDPKGQTTISDDEIVYEPRKAKLYTFRYSKDFPIAISTTRPETKVGDVAVAVHPSDERYQAFIGKEYDVVFCGVPLHIKIITDEAVEKEFGTGALGVTPAHSMIDWEIADRHDLPRPQVINEYAKMTVGDEHLLGKKTTEAREAIIEWLRTEGLLESETETEQNVATAERTGGIIEPLPKLQWFINVNKPIPERGNKTLKELMREPVAENQIKIIPDYFGKTYFHWIDNLKDWCISRQIWYGHRIPVWYKNTGQEITNKQAPISNEEIYCGLEAPTGDDWKQDEDTLDTWFSSALWTFSTLGWPDSAEASSGNARTGSDLDVYHP
ncbi:MAG TPA: class I tRNA ligase family protein, partial [Candidatus Paceibacterota bacterium]|nr:class I tRNA ligase family protein [Candidatus Paceibacterota bacterium]